MIKLTLLFVIIAIGHIHCNPINISNNIDVLTGLPLSDTKKIDIKDKEQMKFLANINLSEPITTQLNNKPSDMNGYYNWLNYLKTSTSTQVNNVTILSKKP